MELLTFSSIKNARVDSLTGTPDQHAFAAAMLDLEVLCSRRSRNAALLLMSIDNLENHAQTYGVHLKERLIRAVGLELRKTTEPFNKEDSSVVTFHLKNGRFATILTGKLSKQLNLMAEHIRMSIEEANFYLFIKGAEGSVSANTLNLSLSLGCSVIEGGKQWNNPAEYVEMAASALEYASSLGGNKSIIYDVRGSEFYTVL